VASAYRNGDDPPYDAFGVEATSKLNDQSVTARRKKSRCFVFFFRRVSAMNPDSIAREDEWRIGLSDQATWNPEENQRCTIETDHGALAAKDGWA